MDLRIIDTHSVGTGVRADLGESTSLYVGRDVIVGRTDGGYWSDYAISSIGSDQKIDILGTVLSPGVAINVGDAESDTGNVVTIHEDAIVRSYRSDGGGVRMYAAASTLLNEGTITAEGSGVIMATFGGGTSTIVNHGLIESAANEAISGYTSSNGVIVVENYGEIAGALAYENQAGNAIDRITNSGIMRGDVYLHGGADLYDGRKGTIDGAVDAGYGDDVLRGGKGSETFHGGDDNDRLFGGAGKDDLTGGVGKDMLSGGAGGDMFVFEYVDDSTVAARGRDVVSDFSRADKDRVDLHDIDASDDLRPEVSRSVIEPGDQAFTFIGDSRFHKQAGELRYLQSGGDTLVQGDVDGDGKADFSIQFKGTIDFTAGDFIL